METKKYWSDLIPKAYLGDSEVWMLFKLSVKFNKTSNKQFLVKDVP
jgi:hypothetical protein